MVEVDLEAQLEAVVRLQARPLLVGALAFAHLDLAQHADEAARRLLQLDARALQQEHEGRGRPVEDRHFVGRDVDVEVVDAQARAGGHDVFDGLHLGAARGDGGRQARVVDRFGGHADLDRLGQVDAAEHDARVGRGRSQGQLHALAAV
ncbi:hypothetical protein D3C72_1650150 [compost metagenome]